MLETTPSKIYISIQQNRTRTSSEYDSLSSSSSSVIDSLSRSDGSLESSLSDPIAQCSIISSNVSSDEDLDFNIGFEQNNDDDDEHHICNKNNIGMVQSYSINKPYAFYNFRCTYCIR